MATEELQMNQEKTEFSLNMLEEAKLCARKEMVKASVEAQILHTILHTPEYAAKIGEETKETMEKVLQGQLIRFQAANDLLSQLVRESCSSQAVSIDSSSGEQI